MTANGSSEPGLSAQRVCELAENGDALALRAVEREGLYLGLGLANLVTLFCPDAIALGGGVMRSAHLLLPAARAVIAGSCGLVPWEKTTVALASLGQDAALLGAACVPHNRFSERNT